MTNFYLGDKVTVDIGSGIDSGKHGIIVSGSEYPGNQFDIPKGVQFVRYEDGSVRWMFKSRLLKGHYQIPDRIKEEKALSEIVNEQVTLHIFDDKILEGKLSNHKQGVYQVTDFVDGKIDHWVFSLVDTAKVEGNTIYLWDTIK